MTLIGTRNVVAACAGALLSTLAPCAAAQGSLDAPAAVVAGSCKAVDFNRASLSSAVKVDVVVQVDDTGAPVSVRPISDVANSVVLEAVTTSIMTCKFQPAVRDSKPTAGSARLLYQFNLPPSAAPTARKPAIVNAPNCAPTSDDYPPDSRRLNETGTTRITFTIGPDGRLTAFGVVRSSGFLRLDFTALIKLAGCKFRPGTAADGTPIGASFDVDYVWKLE